MSEDNKSEKFITRVKENQENYIIEDRFEIIEGVRYDFLSSPKINHQILVSELTTAINKTCHTEGLILFAPLDVHSSINFNKRPGVSTLGLHYFPLIPLIPKNTVQATAILYLLRSPFKMHMQPEFTNILRPCIQYRFTLLPHLKC